MVLDHFPEAAVAGDRLYKRLARQLFDQLSAGVYKVGDRLPAERELALEHNVSRPAVREAMIALEVQGFVEVRIGSGAYVKRSPGQSDMPPAFHATAFELTEARMLFEGEAVALAASQMTDPELDELDAIVVQIARDNEQANVSEVADRDFHLLIARSSRNAVVAEVVERLWEMRSTSPECALLHEKAREAGGRPVVEEHQAIADALRRRDPAAARAAMRKHLGQVLEYLLFATEERAVAEARRSVESNRLRYARSVSL